MPEAGRAQVIAAAIVAVSASAVPALGAGAEGLGGLPAPEALAPMVERAVALARAGYQKAPAVMIGLSALLLIPSLAIAGLTLRLLRRPAQTIRHPAEAAVARDDVSLALQLEADDPAPLCPLDRPLMQIGRHSDNDICLAESTVHRYHAIIEHAGGQTPVITDVSGPEGNGVKLNGEKVTRAELADGDVVQIGMVRLRVVAHAQDQTTRMPEQAA